MPFWDVPNTVDPLDPTTKIWRYMTFAKFVSLLEKQSLYFTRVDMLQDQFEGAYPRPDIEKLRQPLEFGKGALKHLEWQNTQGTRKRVAKLSERQLLATRAGLAQAQRTFTYVNCWHMNEYESAAMWDLYVSSGEGIAVQSTLSRLGQSFADEPSQEIVISKVKYIDYERDSILTDGTIGGFLQMLCKRMSYAHERELRAYYFDPSRDERVKGEYMRCILEVLMENVYVYPTSPNWFVEAVAAALHAFGVEVIPIRSQLGESPVW